MFSNASCASPSTSNVVCAVNAVSDSSLWVNQFNGTTWIGWAKRGGTDTGAPSCPPIGSGKMICVVVGINNRASSAKAP